MTIDYEAAKRALIATRRKNVQAAIDELVYDAERSAADAWANYDRAKNRIGQLEEDLLAAKAERTYLHMHLAAKDSVIAALTAKVRGEEFP